MYLHSKYLHIVTLCCRYQAQRQQLKIALEQMPAMQPPGRAVFLRRLKAKIDPAERRAREAAAEKTEVRARKAEVCVGEICFDIQIHPPRAASSGTHMLTQSLAYAAKVLRFDSTQVTPSCRILAYALAMSSHVTRDRFVPCRRPLSGRHRGWKPCSGTTACRPLSGRVHTVLAGRCRSHCAGCSACHSGRAPCQVLIYCHSPRSFGNVCPLMPSHHWRSCLFCANAQTIH